MKPWPTSKSEARESVAERLPRDRGVAVFQVRHGREIVLLAYPTVLAMLSHTLMWTVDTALLGRVSSLALGAAGLGGLLTWTGYSLFNNLSRITGTFVAQAHGRGDDEAVAAFTWQGLWIGLVCGVILQIMGYYSYLALPLTGHDAAIQDATYTYVRWRTLSAVPTQVSFALMGYFQGRREVRIPMWGGIAGNVVNVVLDVWLIFGWAGFTLLGRTWLAMPPLGILGAAIATTIGVTVNTLVLVVWALTARAGRRRYRIHKPRRPEPARLLRMLRVGAPAAWENFVDMSSFSLFGVFVGRAGAVALAANQITLQMLSFSFMPMWGLTIAATVLTGNNIGAGDVPRAEHYARQVYKLGAYYALLLGLLLVLLRERIFAVFTEDPEVLALGASLAIVAAVFQFFDGMRMVSIGILQGAGDTRYPMLAGLLLLWGLFVPLTWLLVVHWSGDVRTAWLGGSFCYLLMAAAMYLRFESGRWKTADIFGDRPTPTATS
ncbi:MAG: MATE family efflux transporter [Candidatus Krumholzibacteriia bacterium]